MRLMSCNSAVILVPPDFARMAVEAATRQLSPLLPVILSDNTLHIPGLMLATFYNED